MSKRAVCTIITKSYLAYARVLYRTLAKHHPDIPFYVLLADRVDGCFDAEGEPFTVITVDDLPDQEVLADMTFFYTAFEFCNALRPRLHRWLLDNTDHDRWLYLDADIMICGSLDPIFTQLDDHPIIVSPHCTSPTAGPEPLETSLSKLGVYNSGFLGVRRGATVERFADWFQDRLRFHCLALERGLFVDQIWLNLVPHFFDDVGFLTHPGTNVAHWNLHERTIAREADGRYSVNGEPLLFMHFSGPDLDNPNRVSKHARHLDGKVPPCWRQLFAEYVAMLREAGIAETMKYPYTFGKYDDGQKIELEDRRRFYDCCLGGAPKTPPPYGISPVRPEPEPEVPPTPMKRWWRQQKGVIRRQYELCREVARDGFRFAKYVAIRPLTRTEAPSEETRKAA